MKPSRNEVFNDTIDLKLNYTKKQLKHDIMLAMKFYAEDYHKWKVEKLHLHSVSKCESIERRALLLAFTKEAFKPTYDFYKPEQIVDDWLSKQ